MVDFLSKLLDSSDFPPRWHCGGWSTGHGWLHILSDLGVWSAYLAIPCVLGYFLSHRRDVPFRMVFLLFGGFILACGSTHLMEAIIFWWPVYRLAGLIKLITALISWATVFALVSVVPTALALRSPEELEREVDQRRWAEAALQRGYDELERRVGERTEELASVNRALRAEVGERMQAEEALRESRQFIESSLDALSAQIAVIDERGLILLANERWRRYIEANGMTGPGRDVGTNYLLAADASGRAERPDRDAAEGIREVLEGRAASFEIEFDHQGPDDLRWFLMRVNRFEVGGAVRAVIAREDITERKRSEEEVRAAKEDAEGANRAKTQFLAVLSHELRTPLNPILLATTMMLDRPPSPEEYRPHLEMIRQNVSLQARLIDDLLDVMRIVRGKMPLHWEVADGHRLIEQAVEICASELSGGSVKLELDLAAAHHHVHADPARLQQVFWNLIKNAAKFTPEGGSIAIRTRNKPADDGTGELMAIELSDTGIGVDPEVLPRIFEPFQQGETTITRKFGGLGLGLTICKGVVEAHGGCIEVDSAGKDRGTTFRVTLRNLPESAIRGTDAPAKGRIEMATAPPSTLSILVVEDEPATLRLMAGLLRGLGHLVTTAGTVSEAYQAFNSGRFNLILSDIGLPDGTGLDLIRRIIDRSGPVPSIALTGYGMDEDIQKSRDAGFMTHMTKPIDFKRLEEVIRQVAS